MRKEVIVGATVFVLAATYGCGSTTYVSHATAPSNGQERHSCPVYKSQPTPGLTCAEGYACTRLGCEWCGDAQECN